MTICTEFNCTGCMSCINACKYQAISFVPNIEGFLYPKVDQSRCVECKLCTFVCPVNNLTTKAEPKMILSGWTKDENIRMNSSSGGAFSCIATPILNEGGIVFGCTMNETLEAEHIFIEDVQDLHKLRGSKYVQSKIGLTYQQTKKFLIDGRKVLFSGTPCQIAGLKNYLQKDFNNLITVDLICHGVPSPLVFDKYKKHIETTKKMSIDKIMFRCKKTSWFFYNMSIIGHIENSNIKKTYEGGYYDDPWIRGFLRDYFLRPCCSQCQYTSTGRVSDFTIADWWGYKAVTPIDKGYEKKGVSLVLCNTEKALIMFKNQLAVYFEHKLRTIEEAKRTNLCLTKPYAPNSKRAFFWKDFTLFSFDELVDKYMSPEILYPSKRIWYKFEESTCRDCVIKILVFIEKIARKLHIENILKW